MNESRPGEDTIDAVGPAPTRETVRRKFQEEWELALVGGSPPDLEEYAAALAEPDRSVCRGELAALDAEFRGRWSGATHGSRPVEATSFRPSGVSPESGSWGNGDGTSYHLPRPSDEPEARRDVDATSFHPSGVRRNETGAGSPDETIDSAPNPDDTNPPAGLDNADFALGSLKTGAGSATAPSGPPLPRAGARQLPTIPGYELLGVLGRGGMGVVFKARQSGLKRLVALKMIRGAQASETELRRFRTEAEAIARFQHPNIVQIYEVGEFQGEPFFSLELVDGGSLEKHSGGTPQPVRWAAQLAVELADAIDYAHNHGIIHRDLKPANVLLTTDGKPKVTDFGLAKQLEEDAGATASGTVMGTPSYMAPEQASGTKDVGPVSDVYSLGAILYDLLTGRPPFKGSSVLETLDQVRKIEPVSPRALQPTMPRDLETICLKCLQKDPRRRYPTAKELADDLRRFLDGKPILARPVGPVERAWRWARRNPSWAAVIGGVVLLLVGWAATATTQFYEIRRQKETAVFNEGQAKKNAELAQRNEATANANAAEARQERDRANQNADVVREQYQKAVTKLVETADTALKAIQPPPGQVRDPRQRDAEDKILVDVRDTLIDLARSTDLTRASSFGTVLVHQKLGDLYRRFGRPAEGRGQYHAGVELTREIIKAQPTPKGYGNLALMLNRHADAMMEDDGDAAAARELYREAADMHARSQEPEDTPAQLEGHRMAGSRYQANHGRTARLLGDPAAAAARFREAVELRTAAAEGRPGDPRLTSFLAEARLVFGDAAWRAGDARAAEESLRAGLALCEGLIAKTPGDQSFKADAVFASVYLGDMLLAAGRTDDALAAYRKHLDALEAVVATNPRASYRAQLAEARGRIGVALLTLGRTDDAAKEFEASLKLWERLAGSDTAPARYQAAKALALARCDKFKEAAAAADAVLARHPKHAEVRFQAVLCFARCAAAGGPDGDRYAARALELLGAMVKDGYRDRKTLDTEPDLRPLRGRPGFDDLLAKVTG